MREIKFRVWYKGKYYYENEINYISFRDGEIQFNDQDNDTCTILLNVTLEQYTGLKDKNGKEIFEGDTLISELKSIYKVVFDDYSCAFMLENKYGRNMLTEGRTTNLEVIGNIHEAQL